MRRQVFLSYADEDAIHARRLHLTLSQSRGVDVWGYREDGRVGVDFQEEFESRIRASQYFCLLDGPHARRSTWIEHECRVATAVNVIMVVCLLAKHDGADHWAEHELFPRHNYVRAIDLSQWDAGVRELCEHLQIVHNPGWGVPRDEDFFNEVFNTGLDVKRIQELVNLYREFRERSHDGDIAETLLRIVISKSRLYNAHAIVSPRLALGVMQADAGRHDDAFDTFAALTRSHADDPRGWAGLAGAHFHRGRYGECLTCLARARHLAQTLYADDTAGRLPELVHNIASVQLIVGDGDRAWQTLASLPPQDRTLPAIRALRGKLLMTRSQYADARRELEAAWTGGLEASVTVAMDLAACHQALGDVRHERQILDEAIARFPRVAELHKRSADWYLAVKQPDAAVDAMRRASEASPVHRSESPEYRAQLAALLHRTGRVREARAEAKRCVAEGAPTRSARYYRGLAYYLLGQHAAATYELSESRDDPIVRQWPDYPTLLNG